MQVTIKQYVWISLTNLPAFLTDPQGRCSDLFLSHNDHPRYLNYIKLGEFEVSVPLAGSEKLFHQQAIGAVDQALTEELAKHGRRMTELAEVKQSLLAISYEG